MSKVSPSIPRPKRSMPGETYVWFTGLGLAIGILMAVALLLVIFWQGVQFFWPSSVVQITLTDEAKKAIGDDLGIWGGSITKKQEKRSSLASDAEGSEREWQLFVGNKDTYGYMYRYVDEAAIASVTTPKDIAIAERLEYGNAVFYPIELTFLDGRKLLANDPQFTAEWKEAIQTVNQRRKTIKEIEKKRIGKINAKMQALQLKQRKLYRKAGEDAFQLSEWKVIEAEQTKLHASYEDLTAKARALRQKQGDTQITYRLLSGEVRTQDMGNLVHFYFPNQMTWVDKMVHFFHHFWLFLSEDPREANTEGGIFPALFGTFVMTVLLSIVVTPFGVVAAIYLHEYAKDGWIVRSVRISVNNLAGVPSIVFGVFGLGFFVYGFGGLLDQIFFAERLPTPTFGTGGILWASLTLALMTLPVVIVATEEALSSVPRGVRAASLACGASKWQTIQRILIPASAPGILTGLILAMARGAGEVAPLMLVGVVKLAPSLPLDGIAPFLHLEQKFMHLGFHIYDLGFQSPDSEAAKPMVFATTFLLILLVVLLNLGAILVRNYLKKKYTTSVF